MEQGAVLEPPRAEVGRFPELRKGRPGVDLHTCWGAWGRGIRDLGSAELKQGWAQARELQPDAPLACPPDEPHLLHFQLLHSGQLHYPRHDGCRPKADEAPAAASPPSP